MRKSSTGSRRSFLDDAGVDDVAETRIEADGVAEGGGVGAVLVERAQRQRAELLRRVALEQMRAAVDGVHRLARSRFAGKAGHESCEGGIEFRCGGAEVVVGK